MHAVNAVELPFLKQLEAVNTIKRFGYVEKHTQNVTTTFQFLYSYIDKTPNSIFRGFALSEPEVVTWELIVFVKKVKHSRSKLVGAELANLRKPASY